MAEPNTGVLPDIRAVKCSN